METNARRLLSVLVIAFVAWFLGLALRPQLKAAPADPPPACEVAVEFAPAGIACFDRVAAQALALAAGDRIRSDALGRAWKERMAPARLQALEVPIDLNRAPLEELMSLEGVGEKLALRIVARRPFQSVAEIASVSGIGSHKAFALAKRLVIAPSNDQCWYGMPVRVPLNSQAASEVALLPCAEKSPER